MSNYKNIESKLWQEWKFNNPVSILFGNKTRKCLIDELKSQKLLVVSSKRGKKVFCQDEHLSKLVESSCITWHEDVEENPTIESLSFSINNFKNFKFDGILAFGGGSSIDAAKILNVCLHESCLTSTLPQLLKYPSLHNDIKTLPLYALPTTSGTGSEVTPFATCWDNVLKKKYSLAGPSLWPYKAIVDPELAFTLPLAPTISTGLDAINQAAESIWNKNASSLSIEFATRALVLGVNSLRALIKDISSHQARVGMAESSLLAGLAISNTRTALCHSISYPITAHFGVPHGLACAFTMLSVLKHNIQYDDGRFKQLAYRLTNTYSYENLIQYISDVLGDAKVTSACRGYIPNLDVLTSLSTEMLTPGRADNNIGSISQSDLKRILKESWSL